MLTLKSASSFLRKPSLNLPALSGPAFVLGSGPGATRPEGFDRSWTLATVNASQVSAETLGCGSPDVTLFGSAVLKSGPTNLEAQTVLRDLSTVHAIAFKGSRRYSMSRIRLAMLGYSYDSFHFMTKDARRRIVSESVGENTGKPSNGVFLALLCLYLGSTLVVMAGFSLSQAGHAYNDKGRRRLHVNEDRDILTKMRVRDFPVFTSDPIFASESGLHLYRSTRAT